MIQQSTKARLDEVSEQADRKRRMWARNRNRRTIDLVGWSTASCLAVIILCIQIDKEEPWYWMAASILSAYVFARNANLSAKKRQAATAIIDTIDAVNGAVEAVRSIANGTPKTTGKTGPDAYPVPTHDH